MSKSVLLIEDDSHIRGIMRDYFINSGFKVYEAPDGRIGIDTFDSNEIDIVILDIMLPELDGWSVCRRIRKESNVPIIMLTARGDDEDQLMGFELGADEYVTKPFSYKVLVARAKALMKRSSKDSSESIDSSINRGAIHINLSGHEVKIDDSIVELSPKEYDLLLYLIKNEGIVLQRNQILDAIWGVDYVGETRAVDTYIKKLRKKLGDRGKYIKTITAVGYKLEVKDENL